MAFQLSGFPTRANSPPRAAAAWIALARERNEPFDLYARAVRWYAKAGTLAARVVLPLTAPPDVR